MSCIQGKRQSSWNPFWVSTHGHMWRGVHVITHFQRASKSAEFAYQMKREVIAWQAWKFLRIKVCQQGSGLNSTQLMLPLHGMAWITKFTQYLHCFATICPKCTRGKQLDWDVPSAVNLITFVSFHHVIVSHELRCCSKFLNHEALIKAIGNRFLDSVSCVDTEKSDWI